MIKKSPSDIVQRHVTILPINENPFQKKSVEGYAAVPGGNAWYRIVGAGKKGVPLLTLHGGPGACHDYLTPLEALADERPVILYDQLGCGNSDKPGDKSLWAIERYVQELSDLRKAIGLERVHILGHSWGTMLAVDAMLSRTLKGVVSLVLSAPCLSASRWYDDQRKHLSKMPDETQNVIREKEASGDFSSQQYQDAMISFYKRHLCRLDPWPELVNQTFAKLNLEVYGTMWGPSEFALSGTLKNYERADRLAEIRVPTLLTAGRYDEASPETTEHYRSRLPGAEIAIFEDASHCHHIEKTEDYVKRVRLFLSKAEFHKRY